MNTLNKKMYKIKYEYMDNSYFTRSRQGLNLRPHG